MKFDTKSILLGITIICILALASSKMTAPKKEIEYSQGQTNWGSDGSGDVIYLDKHNVNCGAGKVLTRFKLARSGSSIAYYRSCLQHPGVHTKTYNRNTRRNYHNGDGGSTNYLDRHDVECGSGYALQRVQLRTSGNKIWYDYTCVKATMKNCTFKTTSWEDAGQNYENYYLDRQNVAVPNYTSTNPELTKAMVGFRMYSKYVYNFWSANDYSYRYKIKYCSLYTLPEPVVVVKKPTLPLSPTVPKPNPNHPTPSNGNNGNTANTSTKKKKRVVEYSDDTVIKIPSIPRSPVQPGDDILERKVSTKRRRF